MGLKKGWLDVAVHDHVQRDAGRQRAQSIDCEEISHLVLTDDAGDLATYVLASEVVGIDTIGPPVGAPPFGFSR
jgi:hypothetical protein